MFARLVGRTADSRHERSASKFEVSIASLLPAKMSPMQPKGHFALPRLHATGFGVDRYGQGQMKR
jgi:hypothetical protein